MNSTPVPVFVTHGFKGLFVAYATSEKYSFKDIARLITLQPIVVAHLLHKANLLCDERRSPNKPLTVEAIINVLGLLAIQHAGDEMFDIPYSQVCELRKPTLRSYLLGKVLAELAEIKIGKRYAPEFFLVGLLSSILEHNTTLRESCHEDILWRHERKQTPTVEDAAAIVDGLLQNKPIHVGYLTRSENASIVQVFVRAQAYAESIIGP